MARSTVHKMVKFLGLIVVLISSASAQQGGKKFCQDILKIIIHHSDGALGI